MTMKTPKRASATPEEHAGILSDYRKGMKVRELQLKYRYSRQGIYNIINTSDALRPKALFDVTDEVKDLARYTRKTPYQTIKLVERVAALQALACHEQENKLPSIGLSSNKLTRLKHTLAPLRLTVSPLPGFPVLFNGHAVYVLTLYELISLAYSPLIWLKDNAEKIKSGWRVIT